MTDFPHMERIDGKCSLFHNWHFLFEYDTGRFLHANGRDYPILFGSVYCGKEKRGSLYYFWDDGQTVNLADVLPDQAAITDVAGESSDASLAGDSSSLVLIAGAVVVALILLQRS